MLTKDMRELLELQPENDNRVRTRRAEMRERVRVGLHDFMSLNQYVKDTDIEQIFDHKHEVSTQVKGVDDDATDEKKAVVSSQMEVPGQFMPVRHMIQFAYRGMRANGVTPNEFVSKILERSIMHAEAEYQGEDPTNVECKLDLTLEIHDPDRMDPAEKWKHDVPLSKEDYNEIHERLSNHPDVDETLGKNLGGLIDKHLIDDPDE